MMMGYLSDPGDFIDHHGIDSECNCGHAAKEITG
jgi:hypothetical protein